MLAAGPLLRLASEAVDSGSNVVPILTALGGLLLGLGGYGAYLTARAQSRNYVTTNYKEYAESQVAEAADERAAKERAEYARDRWRSYAYALRDELAAAGVVSKAIPPTDHPSEAP